MTSVLRDSLGGNCVTTMIATLSLEKRNIDVRGSSPWNSYAGSLSLGGEVEFRDLGESMSEVSIHSPRSFGFFSSVVINPHEN